MKELTTLEEYYLVSSISGFFTKEEKIIDSIKKGGSIADILRRVGLRAVGDNYNRVQRIKKLIKENGLKKKKLLILLKKEVQ